MGFMDSMALALVALGTFVVLHGVALGFPAWKSIPPGPARTLDLVRALRCGLVGGAIACGGIGVLTGSRVCIGLALIIGFEELFETSAVVLALRDEVRRRGATTG
jgi:hypothetical protein